MSPKRSPEKVQEKKDENPAIPKLENPLEERLENFKNLIQDCSINFLIGSGLSVPFMKTLGGIETWLTGLEENKKISDDLRSYIKACLYKSYFEVAMKGNIEVEELSQKNKNYCSSSDRAVELIETYENYKIFFKLLIKFYMKGEVIQSINK